MNFRFFNLFRRDRRGAITVDVGATFIMASFIVYLFYELCRLIALYGDTGQALDRYSTTLARQKHLTSSRTVSWDYQTAKATLCDGFYLYYVQCSRWPVSFKSYKNFAALKAGTPSLTASPETSDRAAAFDVSAAYVEVIITTQPKKSFLINSVLPITSEEREYKSNDGRNVIEVRRLVVLP